MEEVEGQMEEGEGKQGVLAIQVELVLGYGWDLLKGLPE